jgi:outer membrane protein assembly factor BamB
MGKRSTRLILLFFLLVTGCGKQQSQDDWPMFRHDAAHTGFVKSSIPTTLDQIRILQTDYFRILTLPVVVDDTVYLGTNQEIVALDLKTSDVRWASGIGEVRECPVVARNKVFVAGSPEYGKVKFWIFNAKTGMNEWDFEPEKAQGASAAVVDKGIVYIATDYKVYAFDIENKYEKWESEDIYPAPSTPAVGYGKVFVGSRRNKVYALDAKTGEIVWEFLGEDSFRFSPAVGNDRVYIGCLDNKLYALDATTGEKVWEFDTGERVYSSPAVAHGMVYIGSFNGKIFALDARTGKKKWEFKVCKDLGAGDYVEFSPTVADNLLFIASPDDGKLFALNAFTGEKKWEKRVRTHDYTCVIAGEKLYLDTRVFGRKEELKPLSGEKAKERCLHNLRGLCGALSAYRDDYHQFPKTLQEEDLFRYIGEEKTYCPTGGQYEYYPTSEYKAIEVLIVCRNHPGYIIKAYQDGRVIAEPMKR